MQIFVGGLLLISDFYFNWLLDGQAAYPETRQEILNSTYGKHVEKMAMLGGPVGKMWFFQMAPITLLSVQSCSTRCQYNILKVSFKKIEQNLPVGCTEYWYVLHTNKMPSFTCYLSYIFKNERAHACGTFEVCQTVHMYIWKMYVKFCETILTLSGLLGLRQIG